MIVNVSPNENTWQIHLDGLLVALQQVDSCKQRPCSLLKAVHLCNIAIRIEEYLATVAMADIEKVGLILDMAKLQLREQFSEMSKLFQTVNDLRQIDLFKLRRSVKHVYRNLALVPTMLKEHARLRDSDDTISSKPEHLSASTLKTSVGNYGDCMSDHISSMAAVAYLL